MSQPQVIFGSGHVHVTQVKDALGNKITPPQVIAVPAVQNISADFGKADIKTLHGSKEFALHIAQGKKSTEVSFECGEIYAKMLNALYYGQDLIDGSHDIYRDTTGTAVPEDVIRDIKIGNIITFNLGKQVAHTSATVKNNGVHGAMTKIADVEAVLNAGQYSLDGSIYRFAATDAGKEVKITRKVLDKTTQGGANGTPVVSTLNIPASLTWDAHAYSRFVGISGSGLTRKNYNPLTLPAVGAYQAADNGVVVFNSAQTGLDGRIVTHDTDHVRVATTVTTAPAAGYVAIMNPPSSATFVSDVGVVLKLGTVTGLSAGDSFAKTATPATGQYDVDAGGVYTFAAADAGVTVTVHYVPNFTFITVTPPGDGVYSIDKGVRDSDGIAFTRVAVTNPLSLLPQQYAADDAGTYYLPGAQAGDTLYIDYDYASSAGVTLDIVNNDMGSGPTVALDLSGVAEGQGWLVTYPRAVPKSVTFATKQDDFSSYKFSFEVMADRVSNKVGTIYMTA